MRKTLGILFVLSLVLVWSGVASPGQDGDAPAIVAKAIKAMGGEVNLAKLAAFSWTEKGTYYGMGDGLPYSGNYAAHYPEKFRMEIEGVFTVVINGNQGWIHAGGDTREMSKEELSIYQNNQRAGHVTSLLPLKDKAFTLTTLPEIKVDDRPAVGIKATRKDYPDVKLYFDKGTHVLVKSEYKTKAAEQKFKEVTAELYYSNLKEIVGAKMPMRMVLKHDGKVFVEADMDNVKTGKLDDKLFAKP